jgi:transcriptional regulator with XRE-family HTH domain
MNFRTVRQLLGLKQFAVADAAGMNHSRLSWIEIGYVDPTSAEDAALRRVLLRVIERRKLELETAGVWLKSGKTQTWDGESRSQSLRSLADPESASP